MGINHRRCQEQQSPRSPHLEQLSNRETMDFLSAVAVDAVEGNH